MNFTECWDVVAGGGIKQFDSIKKKQKENANKMLEKKFTLSKNKILKHGNMLEFNSTFLD